MSNNHHRSFWPKAAFLASVIATAVPLLAMAGSSMPNHPLEHEVALPMLDDHFFQGQNPVTAHMQSLTLGL